MNEESYKFLIMIGSMIQGRELVLANIRGIKYVSKIVGNNIKIFKRLDEDYIERIKLNLEHLKQEQAS